MSKSDPVANAEAQAGAPNQPEPSVATTDPGGAPTHPQTAPTGSDTASPSPTSVTPEVSLTETATSAAVDASAVTPSGAVAAADEPTAADSVPASDSDQPAADQSTPVATKTRRTPHLSFFGVLRSEWIKLFSIRSTWWILACLVVVNVGICVFATSMIRLAETQMRNAGVGQTGPMMDVELKPGVFGMLSELVTSATSFLGELIFIVLAVLIIANEYSSGMIRSTLVVVPRRAMMLVTKMIVLAVTGAVVFAVSLAASWALSYLILRQSIGVDLTLNSPTSWRILGGFIIEMILIAWLCFGLGAILRSSAAGIGVSVGCVVVLPMIMSFISSAALGGGETTGWRKTLVDAQSFLPTTAGSMVTQSQPQPGAILGPWEGIGVLGVWAAVALVIAFIVTYRRDV
ncbi:MAG: ABC transporter permease subunit [Propionibacteriaceae bacterium]|nr:ABC transporter permease subunit [Propionibacteriaceae bacterium]